MYVVPLPAPRTTILATMSVFLFPSNRHMETFLLAYPFIMVRGKGEDLSSRRKKAIWKNDRFMNEGWRSSSFIFSLNLP